MTWLEAQNHCVGLGLNLATVNTDVISDKMEQVMEINTEYWIGLNDRQFEGYYEWVSGARTTYMHWWDYAPHTESTKPNLDCIVADINVVNPE